MRRWFRLALFFLALSLEVKVKAETSSSLFMQPAQCITDQVYPCALHNPESTNQRVTLRELELSLGPESFVELMAADQLHLYSGRVYLSSQSKFKVFTALAQASLQKGEVVFTRNASGLEFLNLSSEKFEIQPTGLKENLKLPVSFTLSIQGIGPKGYANMGIPQATGIKKLIRIWSSHFAGSKAEFIKQVELLKPRWREAVEVTASLNNHLIERQLASLQEERRRREIQAQRREEENKKLRDLFRKKNYLD